MTRTIAIISDVHDAESVDHPRRIGQFGHVFLLRTVHRLNRFVRPDAVVILGDLVDDPKAEDTPDRLQRLRRIIGLLDAPTIVIPGNHDPEPSVFYEHFPRPDDIVDVAGIRFLPFIDAEQPGYNARRSEADLQRMRQARADGHTGPIVALQHVPVAPPGTTDSPYGYTNIDDIVRIMDEQAITVAVGGHYHPGFGPVHQGKSTYVATPALCEAPFSYTIVTIDGTPREPRVKVDVQRHQMPPHLNLFDYHTHTEFAYCGENMEMAASAQLARLFGLGGIAFTEHSGQLYFERKTYGGPAFGREGVDSTDGRQHRMDDYWEKAAPHRGDGVLVGLEVDADYSGRLVLTEEDRQRADIIVGAIHFLPEMRQKDRDVGRLADEFMAATQRLVKENIHTLAHPFRAFRRAKLPTPRELYKPVAHMLKEAGVAAEINYHTNDPDPEFFKYCMDIGVKLSFGSDSHNLYEVGEFMPHLALLETCGYGDRVEDVLYRHRQP